MNPPDDLAKWVGSLVLAVVGGIVVTRFFTRGDKADEAFKAEVKADLKVLISSVASIVTDARLQAKDIAGLQALCATLEKRQEAQASAHKEAIAMLRDEFAK